MGFILDDTPEMGEYGGEVRHETFYLYSEDGVYDTGKAARDSIIVYPADRYREVPNTLDSDTVEQLEWIIANYMADADFDQMAKRAIERLLKDRCEWKKAFEDSRNSQAHYGTVEIRLDAIPKIRAVLDAVEEHARETK